MHIGQSGFAIPTCNHLANIRPASICLYHIIYTILDCRNLKEMTFLSFFFVYIYYISYYANGIRGTDIQEARCMSVYNVQKIVKASILCVCLSGRRQVCRSRMLTPVYDSRHLLSITHPLYTQATKPTFQIATIFVPISRRNSHIDLKENLCKSYLKTGSVFLLCFATMTVTGCLRK